MESDITLEAAKGETPRLCPTCGTPHLSGRDSVGCPVCLLRHVLDPELLGERGPVSEWLSPPEDGRFDHYQLVLRDDDTFDELGRGSMGITYRAVDTVLGYAVAIKVIDAQVATRAEARERFFREARAAARLRHSNVASVLYYGVRETDGQCFYAMELVEGETLEARVRRIGPLPAPFALEVVAQVGRAIAAAEAQGLVHRDLKPANLMLVDGSELTVKVIDFGLVKAATGNEADITYGGFVGTPVFASPEQFTGAAMDCRSDLYSLGVTLWQMVTGNAPFTGSLAEVMDQHLHAPLPLERLEGIQQPVVALLEVLLEKDPARRFQSPAELLKAIRMVIEAIDVGHGLTRQNLRKIPVADLRDLVLRPPARITPDTISVEKISVARLPITGSEVFGREEDIAFLDDAWENRQVNVITIVAWGGVGKSTLVNHWLRRMAAKHYRSAELVFGWSFYRQGTSGETTSADEFLNAALTWFGDPDPRIGTAWEKGQRLAKLVAHRRSLLILDGLEPLQNPPGSQEGRLREPSLQALLRELAAFNEGLCIITTRIPVLDIADHESTSARRLDLEQLSSEAGATLLRALGVKGRDTELRSASDEFSGHCLALTLLGSYLTDAYNGDVRCRREVSNRLGHDVRQGVHARKVMESYQSWFGEGPELSVLRMLGLFDRPIDEKVLGALLKPPEIEALTESLADLRPNEWRTVLAKLRRTRLLAPEDLRNRGYLDTHPLVREYFGEQLRIQQPNAWKESNKRLYNYYQKLAPPLADNFREMEPLFLAVNHGCDAGLLRQALHEIYIPRIQRGNASFAANVLGARGALLSALAHFFEPNHWGSLLRTEVEEQSLTAEDQLYLLMQAGLLLTATRGFSEPEARICYDRAEPLCHSLNRPLLLYLALIGQWRYSMVTDKLSATMQIANRIDRLAQLQNEPALMIGACRALSFTLYYLGDFETARQCAIRGIKLWRSGVVPSRLEETKTPGVICLCVQSLSEWHLGQITSSQAGMAEALGLAKELSDMHGLAVALCWAAILGHFERNSDEVESKASDLIELCTRQHFAMWLPLGTVLRGWARSISGDPTESVAWIRDGIESLEATGSIGMMQYCLALKAEALHLADRTSEALEAIKEAEAFVERSEERWWGAELHRLRGVFLAVTGANETQIELSFREAIRIAQEQKSTSLAARAQASYAEYRRQSDALEGTS